MKHHLIKFMLIIGIMISVSACTTNQIGTSAGGAAGAGTGYALTGNGWGAAIGGGAGALIGGELSKKSTTH